MMKKLFFVSLLYATTFFANSQSLDKNLVFSVEVKIIDSQYIVIPHFKVLADTGDIQIHKRLRFDNESNKIADCIIYIQKAIEDSWVSMYVPALREPFYDPDYHLYRKFTTVDFLTDSVSLAEFIPLEKGHYRAAMGLTFLTSGSESQITSNWYDFFVTDKPKSILKSSIHN